MKKHLKKIVLGLAVLVIGLGVTAFLGFGGSQSTDNAEVDSDMVPISSRINGHVAKVLVNDNQEVQAGQVLIEIDPKDYEVKVAQARAALALAEAQGRAAAVGVPYTSETTSSVMTGADAQFQVAQADYEKARLSYEQASTADFAYAKANLETAAAGNEKAQADLKRMEPLVAKEEISRQQFDAYVAAARVAASQVQAAREKVESARQEAENRKAAMLAAKARVEQARAAQAQARAGEKQVSIKNAESASAQAAIEQAQANLAAAELQASYCRIVAPVDGVVTHKSVEPGQVLQPGQSVLMLVPLRDVWVTANFKETQLKDMRPGQRAVVDVDMLGGRSFTGHVDSIASSTGARMSLLPPENATGNFVKVVQRIPVKIVLDPLPPGVVLRSGANVEATVYTH
jgi:membrane fusion protein (multidrug efflux system)